jgi:WD40 repeat protein
MSRGIRAGVGVLAMGAALLGGSAARAQEHVRLVPQLGAKEFGDAEFARDCRLVLTIGGIDKTARLWDVATGHQVRILASGVSDAHFSPDGRTVITVDSGLPLNAKDRKARLWDVTTGRQLRLLASGVDSADFSPDGRSILTEDSTDDDMTRQMGRSHRKTASLLSA